MSSLVSTIIPTRNRAALLGRAIDSVLAASRPGDELIVVDDGSTDETEALLEGYGDRVRCIATAGRGAGAARNVGIAEARNSLIAFLDSDDEWTSDRLEIGRRFLDARPDIVFCFSDFGVRTAADAERHHAIALWLRREPEWECQLGLPVLYSSVARLPIHRADFQVYIGDLAPSLIEACPVAVQTLLVRRERAGDALRFAEDLATFEDWECALRLARAGKAAFFNCETAWQYGHGGTRITDLHGDAAVPATAQIALLTRQLASDAGFMMRHGSKVQAALQRANLLAAKSLLRRGELRRARRHFRGAGVRNRPYTLLTLLPAAMSRQLFAVYDWMGSKWPSHS